MLFIIKIATNSIALLHKSHAIRNLISSVITKPLAFLAQNFRNEFVTKSALKSTSITAQNPPLRTKGKKKRFYLEKCEVWKCKQYTREVKAPFSDRCAEEKA